MKSKRFTIFIQQVLNFKCHCLQKQFASNGEGVHIGLKVEHALTVILYSIKNNFI